MGDAELETHVDALSAHIAEAEVDRHTFAPGAEPGGAASGGEARSVGGKASKS